MTDHIAQLRNIFPDFDEDAISSVLTHCRNDVNAAIEKLLTFSEDSSNHSNVPQPVVQEDTNSKPVEKGSHAIQQYSWMNLPPLGPAKQDSVTDIPSISPSPQWVHPYPYSRCGPHPQSVAIGDKPSPASQPVMKQLPRQQQTFPSYGQVRRPVKKLILMRGLPGSGKSTLARKLKGQTGAIFSTDDYYMVDGVYQFDPSKLGEYHEQNQRRAKDAMCHGISPVIIDNTNTKCHEMKPYVAAALQFNYAVEFHEPGTPWKFKINSLVRKNTHGVSRAVLERMLDRYEHHVTVDMVMGTNKSRPVTNRDVYSAPTNGNKTGGFLIARSAPVTMPSTQHTSPHLKMKRYSHGNQPTSWHGNHSSVSRYEKGNSSRRDDSSSFTNYDTTQSSNITNNSDISNNSVPIPNIVHSNISEGLSIDTSQCTSDIQSACSPQSTTEVVQQSEHIEENHSCPVSDLVYARTQQNNSYYLHHSLSDSVIPMGAHHLSSEPFHVVPGNSEDVSSSVTLYKEDDHSSSSMANHNTNGSTIEKWPSTELYHDSDDDDISDGHTGSAVTEGHDEDNNGILMIANTNSDGLTEIAGDTNNNGLTELAGTDNDIDFLNNCFPDILYDQVVAVYNECDHNIETAVGKLLLVPTGSVAKVTEQFNDVSHSNEEVRKLFQEELSSLTADDDNKEAIVIEDVTSVEEDEKIARALQDQLDKAFMEEKLSKLPNRKAQSELCPVHDDEGLILRLTPSLATTLEGMFGSVKEYLVSDSEPTGDDLVVLLSQKVAKEIYKKWLDTLKAKQIETRHNNNVQLRKRDIELAQQLQREEGGQVLVRELDEQPVTHKTEGQWKTRQHRSKQRKQNSQANKPSNNHLLSTKSSPCLKDIIQQQQQGVVEQESQQVSEIVQDACKNSAATHIKVKNLYHTFSSLHQHYIDQLILEHQFNFDQVTSELERRQAYKPISVVANPSITNKPVKMSPRKHETTTDGTVATASNNYNTNSKLESLSNPSYEEIRAEAAVHARLRVESFQKAAEARSKKQGDLAVFYAQQGHLHTSKMNDANERAAEMILSKSNGSNVDTIDLHGLFVKEALEALSEKLNTTNEKTIYVVTGKGSHSSGGVARIKPAVIDYLDKNRYRHETVNEGQIRIHINN